MCLLISGKAGHGKDTFAAILQEKLEDKGVSVLMLHFADLVKFYATKYCGWQGEKNVEGRALLQKIGNDTFRQYDPNYWARITAECAHVFGEYFGYDYVIIPDNRYPNEIEIVKKYNDRVITIRVNRYNEDDTDWENPNMTEKQKLNEGEIALDNYTFDYTIDNYSIEGLKESADSLLDIL